LVDQVGRAEHHGPNDHTGSQVEVHGKSKDRQVGRRHSYRCFCREYFDANHLGYNSIGKENAGKDEEEPMLLLFEGGRHEASISKVSPSTAKADAGKIRLASSSTRLRSL